MDILSSYGLGIIKTGPTYGHSGEALGWEGWAAYDPDTDVSLVVFTNTCGDSGAILPALFGLYPPIAEYVSSFTDASWPRCRSARLDRAVKAPDQLAVLEFNDP